MGEAAGNFIAPVVIEVAGVTADVFPSDLRTIQIIQQVPEVLVEDIFARRGFPAFIFPALNPFGDAVFNIFAVGVKGDWFGLTGIDKKFEGSDGSLHFHAVVGGLGVCTSEFVTVAVGETDYYTPAARAWVAGTSAVCVQTFDLGSCHERIHLCCPCFLFVCV